MKVKKYLRATAPNIIKEIRKIHNYFSNDFKKIDRFYFNLTCKDTEYSYSDFDELLEDLPDVKYPTNFLITFKLSDLEKNEIEIALQTYGSNYIAIQIDYKDKKISEKYINEIADSLKLNIYKYSPKLESQNIIKERILKCYEVLSSCQNYHSRRNYKIKDEKDVQSYLYPILKSHFEDLEDEFYLPKFAEISYKPDFGIPSIKLLIEVKFIREKSDLKKIQKEIIDDSVGYIKSSNKYKEIIIYIYNFKNVPIEGKYIKDLEKISVIRKVIISPGISIKEN